MKLSAFFKILISGILLVVQSTPVKSQSELDKVQISNTLSDKIHEVLESTGIPSISIALIAENSIIWQEAFGFSNVKLSVEASSNTIYSTGSCFKPVTAMAIMQLVENGKLQLDDPINDYLSKPLKDMTSQGKPVTFRHLLSHYSGISNEMELIPLWERQVPRSLEALKVAVKSDIPPGQEYRYSNAGFALAGLLVEEISGQTFQQYINEHFLVPLDISNSGLVVPTPEMIEELALPYRLAQNQPVPENLFRYDVFPAGDIYLSVPDMAKLLLMYLNDGKYHNQTILSPSSVHEMQTPQFGGQSGLDFGIREMNGQHYLVHGGGVPGYSSVLILNAEDRMGVYIASNSTNTHTPLRILAQLSLDLLQGTAIGDGLVREIAGLGFGLAVDPISKNIQITEIIPASPASQQGLSSGLTLEAINDVLLNGKTLQACFKMMEGPEGTPVKLKVFDPRNDHSWEIVLIKNKFLVPSS